MIEYSFYDQNGAIEVQVGYQNALKEAIIHSKIERVHCSDLAAGFIQIF